MVIQFTIIIGLIVTLGLMGETAPVEVDTNVSHYGRYMGENAEEKYQSKLGMDESIFPEEIRADMDVRDYKMVYYNPWDPQYLSYLVVEYGDAAYEAEITRLKNCAFDEYTGFYGAEGFDQRYKLLAKDVDDSSYYGLVYALGTEEQRIIYVEILFCNYFMDLDYEAYIESAYLPIGFDASRGNPQRKEIMGQ